MDLLRHGALHGLFGGIPAPSTLGSFLRSFTWGNLLRVEKVSQGLLPGKKALALVDIGAMQGGSTGIKSRAQR
jgi:hypothetical protein